MLQNFKTKQVGFALVVGMLFLLVLTILGLVVMRGTQLELAMATAVTRQEQAFDGADSSRAMAREAIYARIRAANDGAGIGNPSLTIEKKFNDDGFSNREAPLFVQSPTAANTGCSTFDSAPASEAMTATNGQYVQGLACFENDCMVPAARMQAISTTAVPITPLFTRNYCVTPAQKLTMTASTMAMSLKLKKGSDVSDTGSAEADQLLGLVANGETADGARSTVVAILAIPIQKK
jgi:hypothetical protein